MEQFKEAAKDPALLETRLKAAWDKIDTKKEGAVTCEVFKAALEKLCADRQISFLLPTTEEGKQVFKQITDPNNTGKVTFEGFKNIALRGVENMKKAGKL